MSAAILAGSSLQAEEARRRALLDERSAALARRGRAQEVAATRAILLCLCGSERYGLVLGDVAQVVPARPCTRVPGTPASVLGLTALSGRVVSVIALAQVLGREAAGGAPPDPVAGHFVVLRGSGAPIALAVDRVEGVVQIPLAAEASDPQMPVDGTGRDSDGLGSGAVSVYAAAGPAHDAVVVIDPRRLLRRYRR